jgi:hypothetical protein
VHEKSLEQGIYVQDTDPDRYEHDTAPAGDPVIFGFDPVTAII